MDTKFIKGDPRLMGNTYAKGRGPNQTSFKKGEHRSIATEFKIGMKLAPFSEERRRRMGDSKRGEKHPFWKGGVKSLNHKIRNSFKMRDWRQAIFERDNYTCLICGMRGGVLNADHYPKTFAEIRYNSNVQSIQEAYDCAELWDVNNGRTLCKTCHLKTDTWGSRKIK